MPNETKPEAKTAPRVPVPYVDEFAGWWFGGRGLLSCLMELETFQRTKDKTNLVQLEEELAKEKEENIITEGEYDSLISELKEILKAVDDGDDGSDEAGALYGSLEGLIGRVLYHNHPMAGDRFVLRPGEWAIQAQNVTWTMSVNDGSVIVTRLPDVEPEQEKAEGPKAEDGED